MQSEQLGAFDDTHLFVLRALADQVAVAIENVRLHVGMQRQDILGRCIFDPETDPRLRAVCEPATVKERTGVLAHEVQISRTDPGGRCSESLRWVDETVSSLGSFARRGF